MTPIQPVVLGLADQQPAALAIAASEARRRGAPLRIVHAAAMPFAQMEIYASESVLRDMMATGQELLNDAKRRLDRSDPELRVDYVLSPTTPTALLDKESAGAQLLVIGLDHVPWYDRLVGAATTGHVVRHALCALLAVPEGGQDAARRGGVIVALDGNSAARPLLRSAFEAADQRGCTLYALQAVSSDGAEGAEQARVNIAEVLAGWRASFPDVLVEPEVVVGEPSVVCVEATRSAELVLVGRSRRYGLHRRPTAGFVLLHAQCPVWIVPLGEAPD